MYKFYRHPDNRPYADKLKTNQKGRHLKAGVFIFGGTDVNQQGQRKANKELFKGSKSNVKYFVEENHHQKRHAEDRDQLMAAARYCRTADATFVVSTLKGFFPTRWEALSWMLSQTNLYKTHFLVADDPAINRGSIALMSAQADEQRHRIAQSSKDALEDIKKKLAAGIPIVAKSSGRTVTKLGIHEGLTESQQKGNEEQARLARERDKKYLPEIMKLQALGMGYNAIARQFNMMNVPTPSIQRRQKSETTGEWYASTVRNIVLRNEEQD
tara:strand:- start:4373 stop:5182 length:810 start_codon:yes stop_codon:yes gene_type:complete